jgi:hypothetical protein
LQQSALQKRTPARLLFARVESRLFCRALSEEVATSLLAARGKLDPELLFWLVEQRDALAKGCTKAAGFLFTTLAILALVHFDMAREFQLLGIKIENKDFFVFAALVVGNLLYVISTGLFIKGLAYEFLLVRLTSKDHFQMGLSAAGFLSCHPGNILTFVRSSVLFGRLGAARRMLISATDFYMKYIMVFCYGIFFYSILGVFLIHLWRQIPKQGDSWIGSHGILFWILVLLNVMTAISSLVIFLRIPGGASTLVGEQLLDRGGSPEELAPQFALEEPRTDQGG